MEALRCPPHGQTTREISSALFISENTIKTHIRHILEKLGASNRAEAVSNKALQMEMTRNTGHKPDEFG